jgi:hypothetical protein
MNYFGHAALSVWRAQAEGQEEPLGFILGSMLPDLLPMTGSPGNLNFSCPQITRGMAFHLEVDALFHQTETFILLNRTALARLRELGVARGPARASAHMGVEMLIDAQLAEDKVVLEGYLNALRFGAAAADFSPHPPETTQRLRGLCAHLLARGARVHSINEERFRTRLSGTLQHRPRLAPTHTELSLIANYLCGFDTVRTEVPRLLDQLAPLLRPVRD